MNKKKIRDMQLYAQGFMDANRHEAHKKPVLTLYITKRGKTMSKLTEQRRSLVLRAKQLIKEIESRQKESEKYKIEISTIQNSAIMVDMENLSPEAMAGLAMTGKSLADKKHMTENLTLDDYNKFMDSKTNELSTIEFYEAMLEEIEHEITNKKKELEDIYLQLQ